MTIVNRAFRCDHICGYMTIFFPLGHTFQRMLSVKFLVTEPGMHFTDAEVTACPYKFHACFSIHLDIAF